MLQRNRQWNYEKVTFWALIKICSKKTETAMSNVWYDHTQSHGTASPEKTPSLHVVFGCRKCLSGVFFSEWIGSSFYLCYLLLLGASLVHIPPWRLGIDDWTSPFYESNKIIKKIKNRVRLEPNTSGLMLKRISFYKIETNTFHKAQFILPENANANVFQIRNE